MRRVKFVTGALLAVLWMAPLYAQTPNGGITGRVVDGASLQPISGVTVTVGNRGGLTEADGRYTITGVPPGTHNLRTSMLGYAPVLQSVSVVAGQTVVVDITLTSEAIGLAELVVVGYGTQRAGNITGAVAQLTPAEFNTGRVVSPEQLIQSKVAGVHVVDSNEPGGGISIRIRGATSVNASSDPLYVIDGVPVGSGGTSAGRNPLNFINPNDIETITVLKDAGSAAIYGANAANGVVMITTKSGRGRPEIEYTGSMSASKITRLPDMLNASQFRAAVEQYAPQNVNQLGSANTDWFGQISRDAFGQEHNLAVSGAGSDMNYRLSLGYLNQDGVISGTNMQRLGLGVNYGQRFFDDYLDIRGSFKGSRTEDAFTPGGVLSNAAQFGATQPIRDPNSPTGFYEWPGPDGLGKTLTSPDNPLAVLNLSTDKGTTFRSIGNIQAAYRLPFFQAFTARVNLGYDATKADRQTFTPSIAHSELKTGHGGSLYRVNRSLVNTLLDAYGNYTAPLTFMPGTIDVTGGYSYSESHGEYPWVQASQLSNDLLGDNGLAGAGIIQNFADVQESKLISFFGRFNYNLNDRYIIAGSLRRDGSSRFGPDNAWGTFPAVSVAWRLSQEPFMSGISGLTDLKLRGSWGKTGNQSFANYQQYTVYTVGDGQTQVLFGDEYVTTIRPSAADPNIKWEETDSYNLGLDYGIFGGRVTGTVDVYQKKTNDMIFTVPIAAGTNLSNFLTTNIGSMENKGVEFSLSADVLSGRGNRLGWNANFNAAHNKNKLLTINPFAGENATQIETGSVAGGVGTRIQVLEKGLPINSFFVYKQLYDGNGKPVEGSYEDLNGDGKINVDDRRAFHDPAPSWILGHSSYLTYGALDLGFTLRAYLDAWVYNNVASNLGTYEEVKRGSPYNLHASVLKTGFTTPQYLSDYYVEDASFLRMDNITLGYSLKYRGQPLRIFATVQSAFTLTGYSGVDPTAGLNGIDNNIYPRSRTFSGGLNVRF